MLSVFFAFTISGCGGESPVTVSANVVLRDGTVRQLSDTPLPLNLNVQLTFSKAVDPTLAEALFTLMGGGRDAITTITWNGDNTVMTARPDRPLEYGTTYTVSVAQGVIKSLSSADVYKTDVEAFTGTFDTMVQRDFNGDGLADMYASATTWQGGTTGEGGTGRGRGYIFYGDRLASGSAAGANAIIDGESDDDQMRTIWTYDIDDDGYEDLVLFTGAYNNWRGRIYFFYGGAGETPINGGINAANADLIYTGVNDNDILFFPYIGDVNGDGYTDIVAPAMGYDGNRGRLYVFFGPNFESETTDGADVVITGESANDSLGLPMRVGDLNGDGIADIAASAQGYDAGGNTGRVYVFYGGSSLASRGAADADVIITGENAGDTLAVGRMADLTGDGLWDLICVAIRYDANRGRVYVFSGSALASGTADSAGIIIGGEAGTDGMLGNPTTTGDVNGDGIDDLLVTAVLYDSERGRTYGFFGGSSLASKDAGDADFIFTGEDQNENLLFTRIGDVNGDGVGDILGNATGYPNGNNQGRVYAFFGGSSIASAGAGSADVIITGENNQDRLALFDLLDVNGDGIFDISGVSQGYNAGAETGRGYLFYGGSGLASSGAAAANIIIDGENAKDRF